MSEEPHRLSAFASGRKRSSCGSAGSHRVKFKIGSTPMDDFAAMRELPTLRTSEIDQNMRSGSSTSTISEERLSEDFGPPVGGEFTNLFVELYDLNLIDEVNVDGVWEESARWIKYEEDVEGADHHRWGQPHVAFLSFHALFQLRKCISRGIVLLDSKASNFTEVCEQIAKAMTEEGHCPMDTKRIMEFLLLKRSHVSDRKMSRISTAASSLFDRPSLLEIGKPTRSRSAQPLQLLQRDMSPIHSKVSVPAMKSHNFITSHFVPSPSVINEEAEDGSEPKSSIPLLSGSPSENLIAKPSRAESKQHRSISFIVAHRLNEIRRSYSRPNHLEDFKGDFVLRHLPRGTESAQVFCGGIHELEKVRFVMVRLETPTVMPEIVEQPIPVRFVLVILGPPSLDVSFHELGRGICTLMSNKEFNSLAYGAQDKYQLIGAIDDFLDGSVVIPPGEVDSKRLLSGDEIRKALKQRSREQDMIKQKTSEVNSTKHSSNGVHPVGSPRHGSQKSSKSQCPFFRGMVEDIRNRFPKYKSDIVDAFNFQCLTSIVFMFFASFAPAITFGGLLGKYTNEKMGTIEALFAQCICGIIWGLFSAQPLLIMSATGPVLIFEASLYTFCDFLELDFLLVRLYAGIWIFLISLTVVAVDGSRMLKYVTRFTEDIFAALISTIFIAESLHFIYHTFQENPVENFIYYETVHTKCGNISGIMFPNITLTPSRTVSNKSMAGGLSSVGMRPIAAAVAELAKRDTGTHDATVAIWNGSEFIQQLVTVANISLNGGPAIPCLMAEPNTALLTAIITFGTFALAFILKKLRESFYLGRTLRRAIGDFGVLISIAVVASLVQLWIPDPYLQRLDMPDHINFTNPVNRGHGIAVLISLNAENWHGVFVALIAALLVFILLFVETEITELLLMRKERGCKKGGGMNWDLLLVGICALLCSIFGLPWMCAAAVQSLAHCSSLTIMKKKAPGAKMEVERVIEQRVTTVGVSVLIGLIAFAGSYLRLPLASLFGVFLYLGVMNLCGVQLVHRVVLFFIPEKYFPARPYTEQVGLWRMHLYTWIQLICVIIVYTVKQFSFTALGFPFILLLFIIFRQTILPKIFAEKELKALEDEEADDEWMDKDFYDSAPIPV